MTIGGTARSRLLLVAFFAILPSAVVGCATARTNTATETTKARAASLAYPQSIRLLAEALIVVQEQQVDAPSLRQLAPASLRGMEHLGQPGAFQVTETATGATLTHRGPAGVTRCLEFEGRVDVSLPQIRGFDDVHIRIQELEPTLCHVRLLRSRPLRLASTAQRDR